MNYLSELISTLSPDELNKLAKLNLAGRELQVFETVIAAHKQPLKTSSRPLAIDEISSTHFDKLSSKLTDKLLTMLAGEKFADRATFILQKGLSRMLLHELKIAQRKINSSKNNKEKKEFYITAFETMRRLSFDVLDLKLLRQYANHLKPYLKASDSFSPNVLDLKFVYIENAFHFLNGEGIAYGPKALKNIQQIFPTPEKHKSKTSYVYYHLCLSGYYKDFVDDQHTALTHAQTALKHIKLFPKGTDNSVLISAYGMSANILCNQSKFEEALVIYKKAFKDFPNEMQKSYYHSFLYCITAMVCEDYDLTELLLDKYMKPFMDSNAALYFRTEAIRLYVLLKMYQRKYDEALIFLRELQRIKRKDLTDTAYIFLRMIENLYTLVTRDYTLAITQAKNNMKFLARKKFTYENCDYLDLFYTINALAKMKLNNKVNLAGLEPHITKSNRGFMRMYGALLTQVIQ